jgi:hypothetical protein
MSLTGLRYESNPTCVVYLLIIPPMLLWKRYPILANLYVRYL